MRKILTALSILLGAQLAATAQTAAADTLSATVPVRKKMINDYSLIGVNYGYTFSNMYFNPRKHDRGFVVKPNYVSLTYTKFSKLFDNIPMFAIVLGAAYGHEGFTFKEDEETGAKQDVDGASWCSMDVLEIPAMMQVHIDFDPCKIMADAGVYGGWRRSIERSGPALEKEFANAFRSYERQIDYGFQGGVGFGIMIDPVEIHFNCLVRWSWSSLYNPDYNSKYYYRYAYPLDIMATVGIHFQLTKRKGKTTGDLKREARETVYGTTP